MEGGSPMNSIKIAANLIRRLLKDPFSIALILILPLLGGLLSVFLFSKSSTEKIAMANIEQKSRLIKAIEATGAFKVSIADEKEINQLVKEKKVKVGVIMPENQKTAANGKAQILYIKQDSNVMKINTIIDNFLAGEENPSANFTGEPDAQPSNSSREPNAAIGFLLMFIFMFAGTCMNMILEDKNSKTFTRMFCAPVRNYEIILGNLLADLILGIVQIGMFLITAIYILNLDFGVSALSLFIILVFYLIASIGINIALAGLIKSAQALALLNFIMAGCMSAMGGSFVPVSMMSSDMKAVANFIPQKWAMEAFDKLIAGNSFIDLQLNLLILLLFGAVFFTFGVKVLVPAEDEM